MSTDVTNLKMDFFSNGIKKLLDANGTTFSGSLNLNHYNQISKVVIFHCMEVASVENLKSVIATLIGKKVLSNKNIHLGMWMQKFMLDVLDHCESDPGISFKISAEDLQRVKAAFQEQLFLP